MGMFEWPKNIYRDTPSYLSLRTWKLSQQCIVLTSRMSTGFTEMIERWHGEASAIERRFALCIVSRRRGYTRHAGPHGEAPGLVSIEKQEWEKNMGHSLHWGFCKKVKAGQDKLFRIWPAWIMSALWAISSCLAPSPGWFQAGKIVAWHVKVREGGGWEYGCGICWRVCNVIFAGSQKPDCRGDANNVSY